LRISLRVCTTDERPLTIGPFIPLIPWPPGFVSLVHRPVTGAALWIAVRLATSPRGPEFSFEPGHVTLANERGDVFKATRFVTAGGCPSVQGSRLSRSTQAGPLPGRLEGRMSSDPLGPEVSGLVGFEPGPSVRHPFTVRLDGLEVGGRAQTVPIVVFEGATALVLYPFNA
jgi:hypothetical protein